MRRSVFALGLLGLLQLVAAPRALSAVAVVLDTWCNSNGYPIHRDGVTDDSTCVAKALAYAESVNTALYVPGGGPILMAGASQATLNNVTMYSDDWQDRGNSSGQYGHQGAVFWITATSGTPFLLGNNSATVEGINFFWPNQSNSSTTPTVYPALFAPVSPSGQTQAFKFRNCTVMNAYDFLDFHAGTIGTVDIGSSVVWAIRYALQTYSVPEVFYVHDSLFSMGADNAGGTNLANWYANNGAWPVVSGNGSASAPSTAQSAVQSVNTYVYGARYGIHVLGGSGTAGSIYLGHAIGGGFDAVETILEVDQYAVMGAFTFSGQYWNAELYNSPSTVIPNGAVYINSANAGATSQLIFSDIYASAHGSMFNIAGSQGLGPLIRDMNAYICVGVTSATCTFAVGSSSAGGTVSVQGNQVAAQGTSSTAYGVSVTGFANISNNLFFNMTNSLEINNSSSGVVISGNQSQNTTGSRDVTGTYSTNVVFGTNSWSKPCTSGPAS